MTRETRRRKTHSRPKHPIASVCIRGTTRSWEVDRARAPSGSAGLPTQETTGRKETSRGIRRPLACDGIVSNLESPARLLSRRGYSSASAPFRLASAIRWRKPTLPLFSAARVPELLKSGIEAARAAACAWAAGPVTFRIPNRPRRARPARPTPPRSDEIAFPRVCPPIAAQAQQTRAKKCEGSAGGSSSRGPSSLARGRRLDLGPAHPDQHVSAVRSRALPRVKRGGSLSQCPWADTGASRRAAFVPPNNAALQTVDHCREYRRAASPPPPMDSGWALRCANWKPATGYGPWLTFTGCVGQPNRGPSVGAGFLSSVIGTKARRCRCPAQRCDPVATVPRGPDVRFPPHTLSLGEPRSGGLKARSTTRTPQWRDDRRAH